MPVKFKSDIETQAGLIDSFGFSGSAGQVLSSTGTKTEWITPPQSPGGGGSSQVFYFNGGTASSVGGYYQMSPVANTSTGADFTINANGYIASFLTDVNSPNQLNIPAGNWNFEIYFSASSGGSSPSFYVELYKYSSSTFTLIASSSASPEGITNGTAIDAYFTPLAVPATTLLATDRLAVRVYVTHSGRTITMHTQNGHLSEVITTFSTGLTALNGLTEQVQYFATGAGGTDFNIASAVNAHTFNLPTASATNRGALSSADWTTFNSKANASGTTNYVSKFTGATTLGNSIISEVSGVAISIAGNVSVNGNWATTYPIYQMIDTRVGGAEWNIENGRTIGNLEFYNGAAGGTKLTLTPSGNVGIGATSPVSIGTGITTLDIQGSAAGGIAFGLSGTKNYIYGASTMYVEAHTTAVFATSGSEKMRITSAGNVGIGTSSPGGKLHVVGEGIFDDGTNGRLTFGNGSSQNDIYSTTTAFGDWKDLRYTANNHIFRYAGLEVMRITNGNVGIGTTSPSEKLTINGGPLRLESASGVSSYVHYISPGNDEWSAGMNGAYDFQIAYSNGLGAPRMTLLKGGNVGIGTTSPSTLLQVKGNGNNMISLQYASDGGAAGYGFYNSSGTELWSIGGGRFVAQDALEFSRQGSLKMLINSSGNVGIGTSSPSSKLQVDGAGYSFITGYDSGNRRVYIGLDSAGEPSIQGALSNGTARQISINPSGGNVGIGTSSPSYKTVIHSSSVDTDVLCVSNDQINADSIQHFVGISLQDQYSNGSGNVSAIRSYSNLYAQWGSTLTFSTTGTAGNGIYERMRITNTGNVGIGNTNPGAKLDVSGDIFCRTGAGIYSNVYSPYTGNMTIELGGNNLIVSNGNVGIGTSSPLDKLDVFGNQFLGDGTNTSQLYLRGVTGVSYAWTVKNLATGYQVKSTSPGAGDGFNIDFNNNVGIGTTTPGAKLDVNGDALINNITIGRGPGNISTNTALGTGALDSTTTANYNIAVGWGANTNNNANGLTAIGVDLNVGPDTGNLGQDCLAIAQFNSNADTAQVPHIYAPKPISIGGGATNIITFDLLHYAGAIVEYLIRLDDGGDYAVGTVYMGWKTSGSGNMIDKRQIEWSNMSGFVFSLGGSGQTLVLTNTSGNNAWIRITVRGMMTN